MKCFSCVTPPEFLSADFTEQTIEQFFMRMLKRIGSMTHDRGLQTAHLPKWLHVLYYLTHLNSTEANDCQARFPTRNTMMLCLNGFRLIAYLKGTNLIDRFLCQWV